MTTIHAQAERKRQDRSVCRAEKRLCRARMLRVRGLIHPTSAVCATTDTARGEKRLPSEQNQATLKSSGRTLGECRLIRLGRANWKKLSEYHRRSRVEAKMRCLKLLGERIMARDFDRQDAEVQIRIALMNRFTSLGTPQTVRMRWHKPGKRYLRSQSE